jgi:alpha-mannosidase
MTISRRKPLYYTFGNHMHWVDMQWLWGYAVLPDSIRDMLHFCNETGAKGNINFDVIGYEKMAVEAPDTLQALGEAVEKGQIEIVGASYGQPYGLFHGSESNLRQRIYGVRGVQRLIGVRPRTFWEEEFDFCPQLPQILKGVGYEYASLFFQWTWHTPYIPYEDIPVVWWEGLDGSQILAATRNKLNLHQWPEDFAGILEQPIVDTMPAAGIVQWLELMPSPDWMCRSELLLPQLHNLIADERFELRFVTLGDYVEIARPYAQVRRYTLDDVFHGMSLGKNGDLFRRLSRRAEQNLLAAESLSSISAFFGRPYPHWDVYPLWELEEAWRETLSAQHHDNDECEGLCGHVGKYSYERSLSISQHVINRSLALLASRVAANPGEVLVYNPLGWEREASVNGQLVTIPAMGYTVLHAVKPVPTVICEDSSTSIKLRRGEFSVTVNKTNGVITQIISPHFPDGMLLPEMPLLTLKMTCAGQPYTFEEADVSVKGSSILIERCTTNGAQLQIHLSLADELDALDIHYSATGLPRTDGRVAAALQTMLHFNLSDLTLFHDHPYGISEIKAQGKKYLRKYPTGHWMTSSQEFEEVSNPFTALQLLDFTTGDKGILYLHDGSQAFLRDGNTVYNVLTMYDPWDGDYFVNELDAHFRLVPHGAITNTQRWKLAQEFTRPVLTAVVGKTSGDIPLKFSGIECSAANCAVTALYREDEQVGRDFQNYAGKDMHLPYILRIVEFDGVPTTLTLRVPDSVAAAYQTNLLGEATQKLTVREINSQWSEIQLSLRPYGIATIYADLVHGRKIPRNLDEHRSVWATVHRVEEK